MFKKPAFTEAITQGTEITLYFLIDEIGAFTWRMNHDMAHNRIPVGDHAAIDKDITSASKQQRLAVEQCKRFGVEEPFDDQGVATPDYWNWYRWWDSWKKALTDKEWDVLNIALSKDDGLTEDEMLFYRPNGTWQDTAVANS